MSIRGRHGQVSGTKIEVPFNVNGGSGTRFLQVKTSSMIQLAQLIRQAGIDSNPVDGSHAILLEFDEALLLALAADDGIGSTVSQGELKVYASDGNGTVLGYVYLKSDGKITIANATQNLYSVLSGLLSDLQTFATACKASTTDPTLVSAATALNTAIATVAAQLGALLE